MTNIVNPDVESYAHSRTTEPSALLNDLADVTREKMEQAQMLTGRIEGRLLKLLVQMLGARRVLEIGMFTGYGTLSMAEGIPADGEIYTCEINPEAVRFAQGYFDRSPDKQKIKILEGDDLENIQRLKPFFDFIFIDGDKVRYDRYYEEALRLLRPGGCMAIDNVLRAGRVLQPEDDGTKAIVALNEKITEDSRVEGVLLPVRDGLFLVRKRERA